MCVCAGNMEGGFGGWEVGVGVCTDKPLAMKIMRTPHFVALGSCVLMNTQKGTDRTRKSVVTVRVDVAVMNAPSSSRCSIMMLLSQYEASGILMRSNPAHWEIVKAMLMALMTYRRRISSTTAA